MFHLHAKPIRDVSRKMVVQTVRPVPKGVVPIKSESPKQPISEWPTAHDKLESILSEIPKVVSENRERVVKPLVHETKSIITLSKGSPLKIII